MICSKCGLTDQVRKKEIAYKMFTTVGSSVSTSIGTSIGTGGISVNNGVSEQRSEAKTLLAEELAPPKNPSGMGCAAVVGGWVFISYAAISVEFNWIVVLLGWITLNILWTIFMFGRFKKEQSGFARELYIWKNTYICLRDGNQWIVDDEAEGQNVKN